MALSAGFDTVGIQDGGQIFGCNGCNYGSYGAVAGGCALLGGSYTNQVYTSQPPVPLPPAPPFPSPPPPKPPLPPYDSSAGPCDILLGGGTPCVAAYSTTRSLLSGYNGPLYQVIRSDNAVMDIGVVSPGGVADSTAQDAFCSGHTCVIQAMYDQSSSGNHLAYGTAGSAAFFDDVGVNASRLPLMLMGTNKVYGAYFEGLMGYRRLNSKVSPSTTTYGIAVGGNMPETTYMVTSGKHYNGGCCFDFGNAEATPGNFGDGTMQAVYFGNCGGWGTGFGAGPWAMADLENGLFAGNVTYNPNNMPQTSDFVTALIKGGTNGFAIKAGNAAQGGLTTMFEGPRPTSGNYQPMRLEGGIILGIGGDNSNNAIGTFFEGCIASGYTTDLVDDAVQQNIVSAMYRL